MKAVALAVLCLAAQDQGVADAAEAETHAGVLRLADVAPGLQIDQLDRIGAVARAVELDAVADAATARVLEDAITDHDAGKPPPVRGQHAPAPAEVAAAAYLDVGAAIAQQDEGALRIARCDAMHAKAGGARGPDAVARGDLVSLVEGDALDPHAWCPDLEHGLAGEPRGHSRPP